MARHVSVRGTDNINRPRVVLRRDQPPFNAVYLPRVEGGAWLLVLIDTSAVASSRIGTNGVLDLAMLKIDSEIVDISYGIPGMEGTMLSNWAENVNDVLIDDYIPSEAIKVR